MAIDISNIFDSNSRSSHDCDVLLATVAGRVDDDCEQTVMSTCRPDSQLPQPPPPPPAAAVAAAVSASSTSLSCTERLSTSATTAHDVTLTRGSDVIATSHTHAHIVDRAAGVKCNDSVQTSARGDYVITRPSTLNGLMSESLTNKRATMISQAS